MCKKKPKCKLIGENGNVFNLLAIVSKVLKQNGMKEEAKECQNRIFNCGSYDEALQLFQKYVEVY